MAHANASVVQIDERLSPTPVIRFSNIRPFAFLLAIMFFAAGLFLAESSPTAAFAQDPATQLLGAAPGGNRAEPASGATAADGKTTQTETLLSPLEHTAESYSEQSAIGRFLYKVFFGYGFTVDGQTINLSKILIALLVFVIGVKVSHRARHIMRQRLKDSSDYMRFLERLLGISIIVIFGLLAMDLAGIPLKAFAFLGGAIAIAIGFGAQEVLANFISGIILTFEKPIRVGDLIEFDGERGKVADIGPRCTRVRQPGNVDLLIPNKKLLEGKLINWTLTDEQLRTEVLVGVAYGSPTRTVEELLRKAMAEHPRIDKSPKPVILFAEFGDNSLNFRVLFWVTVRDLMEQLIIQSELRFRIDELFREADITIAFPQRDVHLDTLAPLEVRMVGAEEKDKK
ncbi:MAG: potassium-dependent mechanosensitive channel [Candidatus Sumerlaeota bacterium]|nr:potassium-dependent mechanosensitive channel [Candidatus Sumerlaeota bacterium]